jgi:hypothetical protein
VFAQPPAVASVLMSAPLSSTFKGKVKQVASGSKVTYAALLRVVCDGLMTQIYEQGTSERPPVKEQLPRVIEKLRMFSNDELEKITSRLVKGLANMGKK